jgi:acyl carrier protein
VNDVNERMTTVFQMVLGNPSVRLEDTTTAADIDGWDSVAHINLMFALESEFGIRFAGNEFARFTDVGELRRTLEDKVSR